MYAICQLVWTCGCVECVIQCGCVECVIQCGCVSVSVDVCHPVWMCVGRRGLVPAHHSHRHHGYMFCMAGCPEYLHEGGAGAGVLEEPSECR